MQKEKWKQISDFPEYQISSYGRIRGYRGFLSPYENHKGYLKVSLYKNGKSYKRRVNRLVAEAFLDNPNKFKYVRYKNGNNQDNQVDNLMWESNMRSINERNVDNCGD